ncbi:precorrin-2 C(20)-methyltransferase [Synechococcus sp. M16CYN]|uniref:precorrin-2 C(20)-methyltransferase n=1 Tax=Synechococcus sp. M16CYN TaxID=3103139 RepID=UPI00333F0BC3
MGIGPGDPSLLTLAAVKAIKTSEVIAYPVARPNTHNRMAAKIADRWIRQDHQHLPLLFPMVDEAETRQRAWTIAAYTLQDLVAHGKRVVLLCEGDSSLFATCSYVLIALRHYWPDCLCDVIPGISSVSAAAAIGLWPLALQRDHLLICPCPDTPEELEFELDEAKARGRVLALLKLGHRWDWVQPILKQRLLLSQALFAEKVGWPEQHVRPAENIPASRRPYFSLLLIRQTWPDVLP